MGLQLQSKIEEIFKENSTPPKSKQQAYFRLGIIHNGVVDLPGFLHYLRSTTAQKNGIPQAFSVDSPASRRQPQPIYKIVSHPPFCTPMISRSLYRVVRMM